MRSKFGGYVVVLLLAAAGALIPLRTALAEDIPRITKDGLKARSGEANLILIDVRVPKDWEKSAEKIAGAVHHDPDDVGAWSGAYSQDQTLVLYCA
ncbi:MAG: hypothetical protein JSW39_04430 [Desulfobacterales bacterium]|nr:MAG: hypothetical protein JSW39_04430 [Desulfobacterales bacterium]